MPELVLHAYMHHAETTADGRRYKPGCKCGWEGQPTKWETEARAQYTDHVRDVAALETAGRQLGMSEIEAQQVALNLTRHS